MLQDIINIIDIINMRNQLYCILSYINISLIKFKEIFITKKYIYKIIFKSIF